VTIFLLSFLTFFDNNTDLEILIIENDIQTFIQYLTSSPDLHKVKGENSLLQVAAKNNRPKFVLWLLVYGQTDAADYGIKNLLLDLAQIAISIESVPVLEIVLSYHPELVNLPDSKQEGSTLLHVAVEKNSEKVVKYLCSRLEIDVSLTNNNNKRADELNNVTKEMKKIIKNRRWWYSEISNPQGTMKFVRGNRETLCFTPPQPFSIYKKVDPN